MMKLKDFKKGMKVKYVPYHAYSDINHKDCEDVVVSSTNEIYVFVKYNGINYGSNATDPDRLIILEN